MCIRFPSWPVPLNACTLHKTTHPRLYSCLLLSFEVQIIIFDCFEHWKVIDLFEKVMFSVWLREWDHFAISELLHDAHGENVHIVSSNLKVKPAVGMGPFENLVSSTLNRNYFLALFVTCTSLITNWNRGTSPPVKKVESKRSQVVHEVFRCKSPCTSYCSVPYSEHVSKP